MVIQAFNHGKEFGQDSGLPAEYSRKGNDIRVAETVLAKIVTRAAAVRAAFVGDHDRTMWEILEVRFAPQLAFCCQGGHRFCLGCDDLN